MPTLPRSTPMCAVAGANVKHDNDGNIVVDVNTEETLPPENNMTDDIIFGKNAITEALISGNREINKIVGIGM